MPLASIILWLVAFALVWFLARFVLQTIGPPRPVFVVLDVVLALLLLLWVLGVLGVADVGLPGPRWRP